MITKECHPEEMQAFATRGPADECRKARRWDGPPVHPPKLASKGADANLGHSGSRARFGMRTVP
jgi:hypothetical protein